MGRFPGVALAGFALLVLSVGAAAAQQPTRVRGTIESVKGNTLAIKTYEGETVTVALQSSTKYAWVVPSNLSHVRRGDFIGTAATGPEDKLVAQELVIFPKSMRGTGEGHYPWSMPAAVAQADAGGAAQGTAGASANAPAVAGTMTNGTVAAAAPPGAAQPAEGTMTNGTVAASAAASGGKELTITYGKGEKSQILVPPNAPVVRFEVAKKSILKPGEKAFVVASQKAGGGELSANFVAVGKNGLMPPM